jgi:predicted transcriptional regulator
MKDQIINRADVPSEKRKKILLFLKDKPRTMAEIQEHLSADPVSILPQIKKLKKVNL